MGLFQKNGDGNGKVEKKKATSESPVPPATTPEGTRAESTTPPPPILEPEMTEVRLIPRLVDTDGQTAVPRGSRDENLNPASWTCEEVAQFLEINEIKCDPLVDNIIEQVRLNDFIGQECLKLKLKSAFVPT